MVVWRGQDFTFDIKGILGGINITKSYDKIWRCKVSNLYGHSSSNII